MIITQNEKKRVAERASVFLGKIITNRTLAEVWMVDAIPMWSQTVKRDVLWETDPYRPIVQSVRIQLVPF